jgi:hypothetical protein
MMHRTSTSDTGQQPRHENGWPRSRFWDLGKHACIRATILLLAVSATAQTGSYRVAGTAVNAVTGEPVSGAMVALLTVQDSSTFAATESGSDGHFAIEHLPAAKFQLTASKRGYSTGFYNQHQNFNSAVVTGEGQDTGNLVFRLAPEAVLSGVVTGDGGDPVQGATVMLFAKPRGHDPGAKIAQVDSTATDDTGAYEFSGLTAGDYLLAVRALPWYAINHFAFAAGLDRQPETAQQAALDVAYPVTFFDSTTEEGSATPIELASGSREQANIGLHAVPALRIQVQTPRNADGSPDNSVAQPDLRQSIFGVDMGGGGALMSRGRGDSMEFAGVPPGQYELTQGDPPRIVEMDASTSQQVDPGAGTPAMTVSGTLQPVQGTQLSGAHLLTLEPVGAATANASPASGDASLEPQPVFASQRAFSFRAVPAGVWKLHISNGLDVVAITADGRTQPGNLLTVPYPPSFVTVTVSAGRTVRIEGFVHKPGAPADGSSSVGWKPGAPADGSSSVGWKPGAPADGSSSVGWKGDKGLAGAMVVLVPKDLSAMAELARRDQSDSDGSFALLNVEPGEYTLVAIDDGWDLDWGNPAVIARYLPAGQPVTVKDSSDNQPGRRIVLAEPVRVQQK